MRILARAIEPEIRNAVRHFPSIVVTGPRRAGKTTVLQHLFRDATYLLLEDPDVRDRARADPRALLESLRLPAVIDEIQNVPELFPYVRALIDKRPRKMGQWLFTGSQEAPLMKGVSESMAGRAAVFNLLPLSVSESDRVTLLHGGYPEVVARPQARTLWFSSYIQTYLERDVRAVTNVRDLGLFRRFLAFVASRHGQIINYADIAAPLGVSVPTVIDWVQILDVTGQVLIVPPYFENFGKRLIKSPKIYIGDSGAACHFLGIRTQSELERSPFLGPLFEGMVASEILKSQVNQGRRKELYYFRDQQGLEVDFLFPDGAGGLTLAECKAAKTVFPSMAKPMASLFQAMGQPANAKRVVVYRESKNAPETTALAPGVQALAFPAFVASLQRNAKPKARRASG